MRRESRGGTRTADQAAAVAAVMSAVEELAKVDLARHAGDADVVVDPDRWFGDGANEIVQHGLVADELNLKYR